MGEHKGENHKLEREVWKYADSPKISKIFECSKMTCN